MTGFESYKTYIALKRHFTSGYDYIKYQGGVNANQKSFEKRNDMNMFHVLSKKKEPFKLLLATLSRNPEMWIGDIISSIGDNILNEWKVIQGSIEYHITKQFECFDDDIKSNFVVINHNLPKIIKLYLSEKISIDTLTVLAVTTGVVPYWDKNIFDPLYPSTSMKIKKYVPFIDFDQKKIEKIIKDRVL